MKPSVVISTAVLQQVQRALYRIYEQATRRQRGTTVKRNLIIDLEIIEHIYDELKHERRALAVAVEHAKRGGKS